MCNRNNQQILIKYGEGKESVNIYLICMILGLAFPIISLVFNVFDAAFDVAIDGLDLDLGDIDICFLPLSFNAICLAAVVFGGVGLLFPDKPAFYRNTIAGFAAYIAAVLIQSLIKYLKSHSMDADELEVIVGKSCLVSNRIPEGGYGAVVYKEEGKADISIPAKGADGAGFEQNTTVVIERIEENVAIVSADLVL